MADVFGPKIPTPITLRPLKAGVTETSLIELSANAFDLPSLGLRLWTEQVVGGQPVLVIQSTTGQPLAVLPASTTGLAVQQRKTRF